MSNNITVGSFAFSPDVLSLVRQYAGSIFVVKYGGSAMKNYVIQSQVVQDLLLLHSLGINIVLVHGGGIFINKWLDKLNIEPKFHDGVRVTDSQTMEIVEMVLVGKVNKQLVSLLNQHNIMSVGLSGQDANLVSASSICDTCDNFTGKVDSVDPYILNILLSNKCIPVIASIASDGKGNRYNINADIMASAIASALSAEKLVLLTDTPGVLLNVNDRSTVVKHLNVDMVHHLKLNHIINGGMIPKVQSCLDALHNNVKSAHIIDGQVKHSLLYEVLTYQRSGSMITL